MFHLSLPVDVGIVVVVVFESVVSVVLVVFAVVSILCLYRAL